MQRDMLEAWLAEGLSLEQIGRRVGKHPSTVAYWVKKHGLTASNAERHAGRGGIPRETLEALVARHLTIREIAAEVDRSPATVRYWLTFHGLRTTSAARARLSQSAPNGSAQCPRHGLTRHVRRAGRFRCARCASEAVSRRRREIKKILVAEAGGACALCGYDRWVGALQFHHVDPSTKRFSLGLQGVARSLETVRAEAAKCVLLCATCHAEVEGGVVPCPAKIPAVTADTRDDGRG